MTTKRAFGEAIALWEATREAVADDEYATLETAERVILAHTPNSLADAAAMLEVVMEQKGDGRSDGLDVRAIKRIASWLRNGGTVDQRAVQPSGSVVDFRISQA